MNHSPTVLHATNNELLPSEIKKKKRRAVRTDSGKQKFVVWLLCVLWFIILKYIVRVKTRFNKKIDRELPGFTDVTEWKICKLSPKGHLYITDNTDFTLNKHEPFCNVSKFKRHERESWTDNIRESLKNNESVISKCQPSDDPHKKAIEDRTHNPKQLYRNAKVELLLCDLSVIFL